MKTMTAFCMLVFLSLFMSTFLFAQDVCVTGKFITDSFTPTIPDKKLPDPCHAVRPSPFFLDAVSYYLPTGELYPIDWQFKIIPIVVPSTCDPCWYMGCHNHERIADPSQYQAMLTSVGGVKDIIDTTFTNVKDVEHQGHVYLEIAKPEASGLVNFVARARIPKAQRTHDFMMRNSDWKDDVEDPDNFISQTIEMPFHMQNLVELEGNINAQDTAHSYIKMCTVPEQPKHISNYYGTQSMVNKLTELADEIRAAYKLLKTNTNHPDGLLVKISFNDLSLMYGGIYDVRGDWECHPQTDGHWYHRVGKSVDPNSTVVENMPLRGCLVCDSGQTDCANMASTSTIKIKQDDGTEYEMTVKTWIDGKASKKGLSEKHATGSLMHLELD